MDGALGGPTGFRCGAWRNHSPSQPFVFSRLKGQRLRRHRPDLVDDGNDSNVTPGATGGKESPGSFNGFHTIGLSLYAWNLLNVQTAVEPSNERNVEATAATF